MTVLACVWIAHLSDLHLPITGRLQIREIRLKRILGLLSWLTRRQHIHQLCWLNRVMSDALSTHPNLLAITGDLTNLGALVEFQHARQWLDEQNLPPTLIVPGNHETLVREKHAKKCALWAPWLHPVAQYPRLSCLRAANVMLIGVNTARPSLPFHATGAIGRAQLDQLAACLRDARSKGLCRVVLLHHPPARNLVVWRKRLEDLEALEEVLRREGAELVLHGHSHRATATHIAGTDIPVISSSSASHAPGHDASAAGWNHIGIEQVPTGWKITVQRRFLTPTETMCASTPQHYTLSRPMPLPNA
ncbi:MAG: metallophosphoesterase [Acetobacter papayae]